MGKHWTEIVKETGKAELIREIARAQGSLANPDWLKTRTVAQLRETYGRALAINNVSEREISRHCDTSFLARRK